MLTFGMRYYALHGVSRLCTSVFPVVNGVDELVQPLSVFLLLG